MSSKTWFDLSISRGPVTGNMRSTVGLVVRVYADPTIEEFMRIQSDDRRNDLSVFGGVWVSLKGEPIEAYTTPRLPSNSFGRYTLDAIGAPLLTNQPGVRSNPLLPDANMGQIANLSFFKLVGISRPEGVTFGISGAYSKEYLDNVRRIVLQEAKQCLHDLVVPVNINLRLVSGPEYGGSKA